MGLVVPLVCASPSPAQEERPMSGATVAMDFANVDLPVLVKFISELTGRNFLIDERVKGKVTLFSPTKISVEKAYEVFLSILAMKGFTAVPAGEVIKIVPTAEVPPERAIHIVTLQSARAEDVAKTLTQIVAKAGAPRRPGAKALLEAPVQIIADKPTNSLILTATFKDFEAIKRLITVFDVRRKQVFVEAVIMEVSLERTRQLGVDKLGAVFAAGGGAVATLGAANVPGLPDLATVARLPAPVNIQALLQALQSTADANVLSTPQLLTLDGQKAEIVVGENRPFPMGRTVTTGGNVTTAVERRDVGITLRLTPRIMANDYVQLDIFQEISSVTEAAQESAGVPLGPVTNKRSASTTVLVKDRQTILIGGLIRDNIVQTTKKVPLLGSIPLLGWLFKFESQRVEKTNLLIFITPTIVKEAADIARISEERTRELSRFLEEHEIEPRDHPSPLFEDGADPSKGL